MRGLLLLTVMACTTPRASSTTTSVTPEPAARTAPTDAPSAPPEADPPAKPAAPDPLLARTDEIVGARSTACVVAGNRKGRWLHRIVAHESPRALLRIAIFADATVDAGLRDEGQRWATWADGASELALAGDFDGAKLAYARAEALRAKLPGRSPPPNRTRLLVGAPLDETKPLDLADIPSLVAAGQRDKAAKLLADHLATTKPEDTRAYLLAPAYVALDRTSELPAVASKLAMKRDQYTLHEYWAVEAIRQRKGEAEAIAALSRFRATWPDEDLFVVMKVIDPADVHRLGPAVDGLRREVRAHHLDGTTSGSVEVLAHLHLIALAAGDREEVARIAPRLAKVEPRIADSIAPLTAIYGTDLDAALAAVKAYPHAAARPSLYALLWARHVARGFDKGFEERLATSCAAQQSP